MVSLATRLQVENNADEKLITVDELVEDENLITVDELVEELIEVTQKDSIVVRLARRVSAFYDKLTGPPFTEQDRLRATLAYAKNIRYVGLRL